MNFNKFLLISITLFIIFSFSLISINLNEFLSITKIYAVSDPTQEQLDQTASILDSIQELINSIKEKIKLFILDNQLKNNNIAYAADSIITKTEKLNPGRWKLWCTLCQDSNIG